MADSIEPAPVELPFWRTFMRYLLSIVASLALGAAWWAVGVRMIHLDFRTTMYTGVVALALGFLLMGFFWLSLDLGQPTAAGVDEQARNYQLFFLWLGIPAIVTCVIALVAIASLLLGPVVFGSGLGGR
jgi:hypothetical protein